MTGPTPLIVFNFLEMFTNQENLHKNLDFQLFFFKTRSDNTGSASLGSDGLEKQLSPEDEDRNFPEQRGPRLPAH